MVDKAEHTLGRRFVQNEELHLLEHFVQAFPQPCVLEFRLDQLLAEFDRVLVCGELLQVLVKHGYRCVDDRGQI